MEFVCLAAGKGSRLGHLGRYLQKAMYPVGLRPFLQHSLEELVASGVPAGGARLVLVVGHHAEQVRAYFGRQFQGLRISYVTQEPLNGTGHALSLAASALTPGAPVLAWQADLFVPRQLFAALAQQPTANVVTLGPGHQDESPALRATTEGGRVTRVWEGQGPLLDIGAWKLAGDVLPRLAEVRAPNGEYRMLPNLQRLVDGGLEVGYVLSDEWIHLGGTLPSAEENVRAVARRLWGERDE
jgi:NDP-sugar pyrophosphorylase family protein